MCFVIPGFEALGTRCFARIVVSFGTILGDGVAVYDSANINVRTLTAPLFAPAPAPLDELVAALIGQVDSVTDQVDVGEALGQVNDLLTQLGVPPISLTG